MSDERGVLKVWGWQWGRPGVAVERNVVRGHTAEEARSVFRKKGGGRHYGRWTPFSGGEGWSDGNPKIGEAVRKMELGRR